MLKHAAELSTNKNVIVLLNSDAWLTAKKGKNFQSFDERKTVVEALRYVEKVLAFNDHDGSCVQGLELIKTQYPDSGIVFCNGGDRTRDNIPEMVVSGVEFAFGVGGAHKANSSSALLNAWQFRSQDRVWGSFRDLFKDAAVRVKELVIAPGQGISYQRHFRRSEHWVVSQGSCQVKFCTSGDPNLFKIFKFSAGDSIQIPVMAWHQVFNENTEPCHIIEVQFGHNSSEEDIERLSYYTPRSLTIYYRQFE